jgi:hypothetical protein
VEVPNLSETDVAATLGAALFARASKGRKQVAVQADGDDLEDVLGSLHKSLRYGAALCLKDGLKLVYNRESGVLKATGACIMQK